ncbi:MAG: hypothetical protein MUF34_33920 [Polyangiaceae bacterium]|nr:hypothetical protein [Polyangiaceae bacterium]
MNRSFAPLDLVTVPRTSASSALALGTALITTARQEPALPPVFVAPLKRLTQEHEGLRTSRQYQREARGSEAFTAPQADQQLDTTWSGLHGLMTAWTKLPSTPEGVEKGQRARVVLEIVFPGGLRFLNLPYREQWGESQTRLDRLAEPAIAEELPRRAPRRPRRPAARLRAARAARELEELGQRAQGEGAGRRRGRGAGRCRGGAGRRRW